MECVSLLEKTFCIKKWAEEAGAWHCGRKISQKILIENMNIICKSIFRNFFWNYLFQNKNMFVYFGNILHFFLMQ